MLKLGFFPGSFLSLLSGPAARIAFLPVFPGFASPPSDARFAHGHSRPLSMDLSPTNKRFKGYGRTAKGTQNGPLDLPHPGQICKPLDFAFTWPTVSRLDSYWIFALDCHHGPLKSKALERAWLRDDAATRWFHGQDSLVTLISPALDRGFGDTKSRILFLDYLIPWPLYWRRMLHQRTRTEPDGKVEHCSSSHWITFPDRPVCASLCCDVWLCLCLPACLLEAHGLCVFKEMPNIL